MKLHVIHLFVMVWVGVHKGVRLDSQVPPPSHILPFSFLPFLSFSFLHYNANQTYFRFSLRGLLLFHLPSPPKRRQPEDDPRTVLCLWGLQNEEVSVPSLPFDLIVIPAADRPFCSPHPLPFPSVRAHPFVRRVRCDLKDLPISKAGRHPSCSNCKERGLKCVYVLTPLASIPP